MSDSKQLPLDAVIKAVDAMTPGHAYRNDSRAWRWTTPAGQFDLRVTVPDSIGGGAHVMFSDSGDHWSMRVPATAAGLDTLTLAMVLAGAIEAPAPPFTIDEHYGRVRVLPAEAGDALPSEQIIMSPDAGIAMGVALIASAGKPSSRYRPR